MKCASTKTSKGNTQKSLECDDVCLKLERNRKLQLAFNIAPDHMDDHIPYSAETINLYLTSPAWAAQQEKQLRAFAADPDAKRLRFKPMRREQRAFIHAVCQDFGFDSESMDPEPHRHIAIFKTPKFVMAPMKTVADCVRIRQMQNLVANPGAAVTMNKASSRANNVVGEPFNALLVTNIRFGLTDDEVRKAVTSAVPSAGKMTISFLPSDEVVLQEPSTTGHTPSSVEADLTSLKPALSTAFTSQNIGSVQLCRVDGSLNVERLETDVVGGGWSQVAAKAAARRQVQAPEPFGTKGSFVVLGSQTKNKKQKGKEKALVAEDWEEEEEREEEMERRVSGEVERVEDD